MKDKPKKRKNIFSIYNTKKKITKSSLKGKFRSRSYRVTNVDKVNGVFKFELANPDFQKMISHPEEKIIYEIKLCFDKLFGDGYQISALYSRPELSKWEVRKVIGMIYRGTLYEKEGHVKFKGRNLQKGLIRILEED